MQGKLSVPRVFQKSTMRSRLGIEKGEPGMGQVDGENEEPKGLTGLKFIWKSWKDRSLWLEN